MGCVRLIVINKRKRQPKEQSGIANPETQTTLEAEQRQTMQFLYVRKLN